MEIREKAFELFKDSNGNISSQKIADTLNIKLSKVKYWRSKDRWKDKINRERGAPKGNKNALGNRGNVGNLNNCKHGLYIDNFKFSSKQFLAKYIPAVTKNIIGEIEDAGLSSLDILWMNITTQLTAIIRSQRIMHVTSKNDLTKELKKSKVKTKSKDNGKTVSNASEEEYEYELQFAWDKQANFLQAQSKAMKTLEGLINSYEKLLHSNWDLATEEQKARIEVLKDKLNKDESGKNEMVQIVDDIDD
ncbi:phage terminase small subunit [Clostridium sp.]|uniref:phage terminase small subunit n=1 Tax=Clostridium sp. TaxID=1506 RepID=UPI0026058C42|nr:phage terminase small subunit [Clostridium sp.]